LLRLTGGKVSEGPRYFGTTPGFRVDLQARYDLEVAKRAAQSRIEQEVAPRAA
jgi:plasmid maintenance system antidote protein VapI